MASLVTPEQFKEAVPLRVERAGEYATRIIDRALQGDTSIELRALFANGGRGTINRDEIAQLRSHEPDALRLIDTDMQLDEFRLAVTDRTSTEDTGRSVSVRLYRPRRRILHHAIAELFMAKTPRIPIRLEAGCLVRKGHCSLIL